MIPFAKQRFMSTVIRKIKKMMIGDSENSKNGKWIFFLPKCLKVAPNYMERESYRRPHLSLTNQTRTCFIYGSTPEFDRMEPLPRI